MEVTFTTISKIDRYGSFVEGKQHIFKESTFKRLTGNMEEETVPVSLCGHIKGILDDGEWNTSWDFFKEEANEKLNEDNICKKCLRSYELKT